MNYIIGIDIGGTNFRMGLVNEEGAILKSNIVSSAVLTQNMSPLLNLKIYIIDFINKHLQGDLVGISIGVPSTINREKTRIYSTPNIKGFDNLEIVDYLRDELKVPVFLDRDVNFLLKKDMVDKKIDSSEVTLGFYIGTGIGNSIFLNGDFYSGKNGVAGELGHIPLNGLNDACGCGNRGCAEVYAAGRALRDIREEHYRDTDISNIFAKHRNDKVISDFINLMSIPVATEINILDPDNVVLGGGVIQMERFPKGYLEQCIYEHTRKPFPASGLNIVYSDADINAGVIGGAYYGFEKLKKINK